MGSPTCRLRSAISITFAPAAGMDSLFMTLTATRNGVVDMHGALFAPTWTRLSQTANAGARWVAVQQAVNWLPGQLVAVPTSIWKDECRNQNEVRVIESISGDGMNITFTTPLSFRHYGGPEYQTEVVLLSRNILLQGSPETAAQKAGGHVRIGSASARFRGVMTYRMGNQLRMGSYPFHFHLSGEVTGISYLTDNSVYNSYHRCYTMHGTYGLVVANNTAFHVHGSCYYIEDGVEERNVVDGNFAGFVHPLGRADTCTAIASVASTITINQTDTLLIPSDWAASCFYITNPYNFVTNNAASGGTTGYSFLRLAKPVGDYRDEPVEPFKRPVGSFDSNTAHSSGYHWGEGAAIYVGGNLQYAKDNLTLQYQIFVSQFDPSHITTMRSMRLVNVTPEALVYNPPAKGGLWRFFQFLDSDGSFTGSGRPTIAASYSPFTDTGPGPVCNATLVKNGAVCTTYNYWRTDDFCSTASPLGPLGYIIGGVQGRFLGLGMGRPSPRLTNDFDAGYVTQFGYKGANRRYTILTRVEGITGLTGKQGWYVHWTLGAPKFHSIRVEQIPRGSSIIYATRYPAGTTFSIVRMHSYLLPNSILAAGKSLADVLNSQTGEVYYFDGKILYLKLIDTAELPYLGRTAAINGGAMVPGIRTTMVQYNVSARIPPAACPSTPVPAQNGQNFTAQFCPMKGSVGNYTPPAITVPYDQWHLPYCAQIAPPVALCAAFGESAADCTCPALAGRCEELSSSWLAASSLEMAALVAKTRGYCAVTCGRCEENKEFCMDMVPPSGLSGGLTCAQLAPLGRCHELVPKGYCLDTHHLRNRAEPEVMAAGFDVLGPSSNGYNIYMKTGIDPAPKGSYTFGSPAAAYRGASGLLFNLTQISGTAWHVQLQDSSNMAMYSSQQATIPSGSSWQQLCLRNATKPAAQAAPAWARFKLSAMYAGFEAAGSSSDNYSVWINDSGSPANAKGTFSFGTAAAAFTGAAGLSVSLTRTTGVEWNAQLAGPRLELLTGKLYTFCVWACLKPRPVQATPAQASVVLYDSTTQTVYARHQTNITATWKQLCAPRAAKPEGLASSATWGQFKVNFGTAVDTFYFDHATIRPSVMTAGFESSGSTSDGYRVYTYSSGNASADAKVTYAFGDREATYSGGGGFAATVSRATGTYWHVQLVGPRLELLAGKLYTFCVWARLKPGPGQDTSTRVTALLQDTTILTAYARYQTNITITWQQLCLPRAAKPEGQGGVVWAEFKLSIGAAVNTYNFDQAAITVEEA
ncbi:hypothetical protein GPECTOR_13g808 [Gonium pectorale]|uniref:G8 domain-containing protein n=1 Tax=Gonium pectorale TaxID=33097 RepID=A0A150GNF1_GONPE|nr:hypothetical protein GPECTOR_13g808 [Gonium pectorale]|eukprot:KXZ51321.1 hypothetical protein GPECTOR_13g808 [Gonium pectorale]